MKQQPNPPHVCYYVLFKEEETKKKRNKNECIWETLDDGLTFRSTFDDGGNIHGVTCDLRKASSYEYACLHGLPLLL